MTDEPAPRSPAPRSWTRADTDALLDAALARPHDFDTAFIPPPAEETERLRAQTQPCTAPLTQAQLDEAFEKLRTWNGPYA